MNQELYDKLINSATVAERIARFNKRINAKQKEVEQYDEALAQVSDDTKASISACIKCIIGDVVLAALGCIVSVVTGITMLVMLIVNLTRGNVIFGNGMVGAIILFVVANVIKFVGNVLFIVDIIRLIITLVKCKKIKKSLMKKRESVKSEQAEFESNLSEYMAENGEIIDFIPETYRNSQDILCMLKAVNEQNLETLQEAVAYCTAE